MVCFFFKHRKCLLSGDRCIGYGQCDDFRPMTLDELQQYITDCENEVINTQGKIEMIIGGE